MDNNEKKMTSYERKVLAKEEAAKREKRKAALSIIATVAIVACLAALLIVVPMMKNRAKFKEYFKINNESVSELEFNFHMNNIINSNASYLQYFGMTSVDDLNTMVYDEATGLTWADYFAERAAESIKENRALIADAKAKGVDIDVTEDYKTYIETVSAQATEAGMSTDEYLTALFGAKEKELKDIIKDNLAAVQYSEYLYEQNKATEAEAQAEYDANKDLYDAVDYRVLSFAPVIPEGADEAATKAAKDDAKAKAEEMLAKVKAGEDFETLCATYAPEDQRAKYADSETDSSLVTGESSSFAYGPYSKWLFEAARTEGEADIYVDETSGVCYVLKFEKRYMGENILSSIQQDLTYNTVMDYVAEVSKDYTISDPDDNLPTL